MSHIRGKPVFDSVPVQTNANYFDLVRFLAKRDHVNYPRLWWFLKYLTLAFRQPVGRPMPIPLGMHGGGGTGAREVCS